MNFYLMTCMATPQLKNLCHGDHDMYNFGRPWSPLLYNWFLWTMPRSREEYLFKKYINFTIFTPKLPPHYGRSSLKIYNSLSLSPIDATNQICFRLAQKSFIRRCYLTRHDEGRQPIAIGNPSNPGDKKS